MARTNFQSFAADLVGSRRRACGDPGCLSLWRELLVWERRCVGDLDDDKSVVGRRMAGVASFRQALIGLVELAGSVLEVLIRAHLRPLPRVATSGGLTPERMGVFKDAGAPVDSYAVGSFISGATPIDFTGDIKEIDGRSIAKRGRIPGRTESSRPGRIKLEDRREA